MRFFSSWWERLPVPAWAPTVLMALAVIGALNHAGPFIKAFAGPDGFAWG